ncbi:RAD55 family ATPase [Methylocystis rosea]|uniref:RAD55 family ATPase n=1 Tax=Methylocystis rosea TaxID=173366 RepID=UPI0012ECAAE5|nr:AAA family ATPase [Methylocystis rosea]
MIKRPLSPSDFLLAVPFEKASQVLWSCWFAAAKEFLETPPDSWQSHDFIAKVNDHFAPLSRLPTRIDPHITAGVFSSARHMGHAQLADQERITRPYLVMREQFESAAAVPRRTRSDELGGAGNRPRRYLPSPLYFLRQMLTSPDYPSSEAYAHALIRAHIFADAMQLAAASKPTTGGTDLFEILRHHLQLEKIGNSLAKAAAYRRKVDTFPITDPTDFIVGHLLASKGLAVITTAPSSAEYKSQRAHEKPVMGVDAFISAATLLPGNSSYEFRFVPELTRMPAPSEIINQLDGVPLALPGAAAIFDGGLRTSTRRGTVVRVSGSSGCGKTSFALALAASCAPLGMSTCYLSCEEDKEDLERRLTTLIPPFVAKTVSFNKKIRDWFEAHHIDAGAPDENMAVVEQFIASVRREYTSKDIDPATDRPPGVVPLLVVFDGVHELLKRPSLPGEDQVNRMRAFVESFRELGAIVVIMSADLNEPALRELNYVVDVVVTLEHDYDHNSSDEPRRKFVLQKTRLQRSFAGAHHFHISRDEGVKIYPQIATQLEPYAAYSWKSVNKNVWYDFLQTAVPVATAVTIPLVRIFNHSQVLLGGNGSSGKAAFALRLLSSGLLTSGQGGRPRPLDENPDQKAKISRRILVVSFLYTDEYYQSIAESIKKSKFHDALYERTADPRVDVVSFYPGFLAPEVFLSKVMTKIVSAELQGAKFEGILIDGLHNVFLQFPRLEEAKMLWPTLFEMLRVVGVTVVATHTHFTVHGMEEDPSLQLDVRIANNRIAPLLQALVNSADFYLDVSAKQTKDEAPNYEIRVISAFGQSVSRSEHFWNREKMYVEQRRTRLL